MTDQNTADQIAHDVISLYDSLPHNGKPVGSQFTVLAGVVATVPNQENFVICIATGTKCLSNHSSVCEFGSTIADSHAEVIARRSFIRYLFLAAIEMCRNPDFASHPYCPMTFENHTNKFCLKSGWRFWLYISDSPCGEASVYDRTISGRSFSGKKSRLVESLRNPAESEAVIRDSYAACDNSVLGSVLRAKPGRVDMDSAIVCSSMSCCDKIARWLCLGIQG
jgi:hypothetical protein